MTRLSIQEALFQRGFEFDFFQAVRLLAQIYPQRKAVGGVAKPTEEFARFGAQLTMAFPASAVHDVEPVADSPDMARVTVAFLALTGTQGVLPLNYTEWMIARKAAKDTSLAAFLDLFNHRLISLFYRAWEKHRPPVLYEVSAARGQQPDPFTHSLYHLIGMGTEGLRNRMAVQDQSLLFYAGLIAQRPHSAAALRGILRDYFAVPIEIDQCLGSWYELENADRCYLSSEMERNQLGEGAFIGEEVWDQQSRFRIRMGPVGIAEFIEFLPDTVAMEKLVELTRYLAGSAIVFDVQVFLRAGEVPGCRLDDEGFDAPRLGWLGWLKTSEFNSDPGDGRVFLDQLNMPTYTQTQRRIAISTPLGKDVLLLRGFTGSEAISQLFHFDLDLLSESDSIKFQDIVGKDVTLRIMDAEGEERYWNGFISRFSQGTQDLRLTAYRAQMVPWLWFLTRTADCRIFQNKTVPDIIKKIFEELKFKDFELRLFGDFPPRDYCVQYRETDFNFVSRLMEEEGICYYFLHQNGKHILILANDPAAHDVCEGQESASYDNRAGASTHDDVITKWQYHEEFRPGAWAQTDYNFETPSTNLHVSVAGTNPYEIFEFPGEHRILAHGDKLARIRLEEQAVPCVVSQGAGSCRHFSPGFRFSLEDHYRADLNKAYLLTGVRHRAVQHDYVEDGGGGEELNYENSFDCIPFSTPFRPQRITPQPFVQGCQTAVVVGPAGEEIYTDKHGRVKVQFHWDREGKKNENSSCWIRVSHPWAGKGYGSVSIPRIGQEVIVDFLEGDPDQPIIIGRVYNAEQMPPTGLPKAGMVSGIRSNSTPGGGGFNAMTMDDTKGKEKIDIHSQHDMSTTVQHDDTQTIVSGDRTIKVVAGKHTETIKSHMATTVESGNHSLTVQTGTHTEDVKGDVLEIYQANQTTTVKDAIAITSETAHIYVHSATSIQLHVGASKLWMASDGNISLEGVNVTISGSDLVTIKGQIVHSEATAEHQTKGAIVISEGSATNTVKGGMVMLNP